jgi:ribosome-interacting GTPase 1
MSRITCSTVIFHPYLLHRIILQPKGMTTDFTAPVVLHDNAPSTEDFCNRLHKQLMMQFKYAWVWGSSVRHQPQKVTIVSIFLYCALLCVVCT